MIMQVWFGRSTTVPTLPERLSLFYSVTAFYLHGAMFEMRQHGIFTIFMIDNNVISCYNRIFEIANILVVFNAVSSCVDDAIPRSNY